ncbi:hypothetical protein CDAR_557731 [Caerostris darwini]|uniref:Uncharacterized protein n=1 Tax=Caerostris darwini TaxID=1538125 RepID=A0AAV4W1N5_9ARAC|nr:hypothetical protein CDAR_557731 [Caerostris darwini]
MCILPQAVLQNLPRINHRKRSLVPPRVSPLHFAPIHHSVDSPPSNNPSDDNVCTFSHRNSTHVPRKTKEQHTKKERKKNPFIMRQPCH